MLCRIQYSQCGRVSCEFWYDGRHSPLQNVIQSRRMLSLFSNLLLLNYWLDLAGKAAITFIGGRLGTALQKKLDCTKLIKLDGRKLYNNLIHSTWSWFALACYFTMSRQRLMYLMLVATPRVDASWFLINTLICSHIASKITKIEFFQLIYWVNNASTLTLDPQHNPSRFSRFFLTPASYSIITSIKHKSKE